MTPPERGAPRGGAQDVVAVRVEALPHAEGLPLPSFATGGSAGCDFLAALPEDRPLTLEPGARVAVPTGLKIAIPPGFEGQIRPRSGLALHHGVTVLNAPGTLDADFRGEVMVILINLGREQATVCRGDRVAQLVIAPVLRLVWQAGPVDAAETTRGAGGFGSTGRHRRPSPQDRDG